MSPVDTGVMYPELRLTIGGVEANHDQVQEVRVQDSLALPAAFSITFTPRELGRGVDPLGVERVDPSIGKEVEISIGAPGESGIQKLFAGEITALEPNFGPEGIRLVASGYDPSHRLHRNRKTRTFQKMTTSAIVQKVVGEAGVTANVEATQEAHEFLQQNNETDWELVQRLASMHDYEAVVEGKVLRFRKIAATAPQPLELEFGENTSNGSAPRLHSFYPRVTAAQQVKEVLVRGWDPKTKKAIEAKETVKQRGTKIGIPRDGAIKGFGNSVITVADAPVATQEEATAFAQSMASYLGHMFVSAYGACEGNPRIRAGTTLKIKGLGPEFSGTYRVSAATHVYGGGYSTTFEVLGRSPRDLLDLARPATKNVWGDSLVVGIVTNNQDKDTKMARVRVKYPALDGSAEGAWARVVGIGAGKDRGQMMLPQVNDEVLIGFEGGDPHKPYVLGALWNGKDTPKPDHLNPAKPSAAPDGSYVLRSPKLIDMAALDNVKITSEKEMIVEVKGKSTEKVGQTFSLDAADELTLVCGKAKIVLKKTGEIQIMGSNVTVEGQAAAKLKGATVGVEGSGPVTVKGATVAIN